MRAKYLRLIKMNRWLVLFLVALAWTAGIGAAYTVWGGKPEGLWAGIDKDSWLARRYIYRRLDMNAIGWMTFGIAIAACMSLGWLGLAIFVGGLAADEVLRSGFFGLTERSFGRGVSAVLSFINAFIFVVWYKSRRKLPNNVVFSASAGLFGNLVTYLTDLFAYGGGLYISHGWAHTGAAVMGYAAGALFA